MGRAADQATNESERTFLQRSMLQNLPARGLNELHPVHLLSYFSSSFDFVVNEVESFVRLSCVVECVWLHAVCYGRAGE